MIRHIQAVETENPDALVALQDQAGIFVYASSNHTELLGFTPEEMMDVHWTEHVHMDDHKRAHVNVLRAKLSGHPVDLAGGRVATKDGRHIPTTGTGTYIQDPATGSKYMLIVITLIKD